MGKCLSCYKDEGPKEEADPEAYAGPLELRIRPTPVPDLINKKYRGSTCKHRVKCDTSSPPLPHISGPSCLRTTYSPETYSNGSNKRPGFMGVTGTGSGGSSSDRRSLYSRIPPLPRSTTHESRRHSTRDSYSETKINTLFDVYREPPLLAEDGSSHYEDVILTDGIQRFCADLEISPDDFRILLFAWKCDAQTMCRFTRSEFVAGCKALKVDSMKGILLKFTDLQAEVQEFEPFKSMYKWAFKFGLDSDIGQRSLPTDIAALLWKLVFEQRKPAILDRWLAFLESHPYIRGIPRDTWNMFLNFSETAGNDLSTYDDTEAWPSLFDDFVEYENDQLNQNISKDQKQ